MSTDTALVTDINNCAVCLRKLTQLAAGTAGEGLDEVFSDYVGAVLNGALGMPAARCRRVTEVSVGKLVHVTRSVPSLWRGISFTT